MSIVKFWLLLNILTIFSTAHVFAYQNIEKTDASQNERPRIGLVLSGGGARGAAHIGVLKALEELGISVDMIAGTSMGALIGGFYAAGYTAAEIEQISHDIDWQSIFDDRTERKNLQFRHKRIGDDRLMDFKLGFKDKKIIFPKGLIKGQKLLLQLKQITYPVQKITDFDDLPIPFRAVATDIESGQAVILGKDDLGLALFASMSIPALLPPVEIDGKLLVDGSVANNLPIDVVRQMGADFIIVVDVGSPLLKKEKIKSVLSVTNQLIRLLGYNNSLRQVENLEKSDIDHVIIRPDLTGFSTGNFMNITDAIPKGMTAANKFREKLAQYATKDNIQLVTTRLDPIINFVKIENNTNLSDAVILRHLDIRTGLPLSPKELNEKIAIVYGLDAFERVSYDLMEEDGKTGILIKAEKSSIGKNHIRFGLLLSDNLKGDSSYSLLSSLTMTEINDLGAELRFDAEIGENMLLSGEYYQPLNIFSNLFVSTKTSLGAVNSSVFDDGAVTDELRISSIELSGFAGVLLGTWGEAKVGLTRQWIKVRENDGSFAFFSGEKIISTGIEAQINVDTFDRISFTKNGLRLGAGYYGARKILGGDNEFDLFTAGGRYVRTFGKNTLDFALAGGATFGRGGQVPSAFSLGGFQLLSGLARNQIRGAFMGYAAIRYHRQLTKEQLNVIDLPIYIGASLETGNTWNKKSDVGFDSLIFAGSVFLGIDSPFGPIYFGFGMTDRNEQSLHFSLGQSF